MFMPSMFKGYSMTYKLLSSLTRRRFGALALGSLLAAFREAGFQLDIDALHAPRSSSGRQCCSISALSRSATRPT